MTPAPGRYGAGSDLGFNTRLLHGGEARDPSLPRQRPRPSTPCRVYAAEIVVADRLDPGCSDACPTGALRVAEDGTVETQPELCLVCLACMAVCGPDKVKVLSRWECPG